MEKKRFERSSFLGLGLALATMAVSACSGGDDLSGVNSEALTALCQEMRLASTYGAPRDGIPALTDPDLVTWDDNLANYLVPTDRVIGLHLVNDYVAIPHNILWHHEIVNFNQLNLAITYCPFTGSSMVFQRSTVDDAEFGVSGLLFGNNLVMYDRAAVEAEETLWPQMLSSGRCGPGEAQELTMFPAIEIEWGDWVALHPDTRVVSRDTGFSRIYLRDHYPYGWDYEREDNAYTLQVIEDLDPRRPPKERLLGIPFGDGGGIAFPFGALRDAGDLVVIHETISDGSGGQKPIVVFWDSEAVAAMAFRPWVAGQDLTFEVSDGAFMDLETGSRWSLDGEALSGPLAGQVLAMTSEAYVSFWFAFSQFFPNTELWLP